MSLEELGQAVETGNQGKAKLLAQELVEEGVDLMQMIAALTEVMERVGEKFSRLEIFLPEMVLTGGAMTAVMQILTPHLAAKGRGEPKAKVVLGTVKGDLHEIGKDIVKLMLESSFYEVKDLGTDVDPVDFGTFAGDFGGAYDEQSDFDWDGDVDPVDFGSSAGPFGH